MSAFPEEIKEGKRTVTAQSLAEDILLLSRNTLLVSFRFLDRAVSHLRFEEDAGLSLATDGETVYYDPMYIISLYSEETQGVARALLHCIMHCVFRHNFIGPGVDRSAWDFACDAAVEIMMSELGSEVISSSRTRRQSPTIEVMRENVGAPLTAERIYSWAVHSGFSSEELSAEREPFIADMHGVWYGDSSDDAAADRKVSLRKIWEDVSKRMQTELETMSDDRDGALVQSLRSLNRKKNDYGSFLKRFAVHGETMRLSEEEFDHNYYTYGMELYGNIPLIEPLEYSEVKRIRDFVIAIDTSGSVRGDVVQNFIQQTYDILMRRESFFTKVNIYIIQCDCAVRDAAHIASREDFERYIENLEIKGLGKTDFRPVFSYTDRLIREGKLNGIQGLIYFTDGFGVFPMERPAYDTAFILHTEGAEDPEIPAWAQYLTVTEEEILDKRIYS